MSGGGTPYKYFSGKGSGLFHQLLAKLPGGWGEKVCMYISVNACCGVDVCVSVCHVVCGDSEAGRLG